MENTLPLVHYVRNSSGGPEYPHICRTALITWQPEPPDDGLADLAVFDPEGFRNKHAVCYDGAQGKLAPGTWHRLTDHNLYVAPGRPAADTAQEDQPVSSRWKGNLPPELADTDLDGLLDRADGVMRLSWLNINDETHLNQRISELIRAAHVLGYQLRAQDERDADSISEHTPSHTVYCQFPGCGLDHSAKSAEMFNLEENKNKGTRS